MESQEYKKINKAGHWVNIVYVIACFSMSPGISKQPIPGKDNVIHKTAPIIKAIHVHEKIQHSFRGHEYAKK